MYSCGIHSASLVRSPIGSDCAFEKLNFLLMLKMFQLPSFDLLESDLVLIELFRGSPSRLEVVSNILFVAVRGLSVHNIRSKGTLRHLSQLTLCIQGLLFLILFHALYFAFLVKPEESLRPNSLCTLIENLFGLGEIAWWLRMKAIAS